MMTVLPTPAPPKTPVLPPLVNGAIRSMTLMPVSKTSTCGRLLLEGRGRAVDRVVVFGVDRACLVDRLADHVEDAAQRCRADRHGDRRAGVDARPCRGAGRRCELIATARTQSLPRCCCVSSDERRAVVQLVDLERVVDLRAAGPAGTRCRPPAPMTCTILPGRAVATMLLLVASRQC